MIPCVKSASRGLIVATSLTDGCTLQYTYCIMTLFTTYDYEHQNGLKNKPEVNWDNDQWMLHYLLHLTLLYIVQCSTEHGWWVDKNNTRWTLMIPWPMPSLVMMLSIMIIPWNFYLSLRKNSSYFQNSSHFGVKLLEFWKRMKNKFKPFSKSWAVIHGNKQRLLVKNQRLIFSRLSSHKAKFWKT